MSMKYNGDIMEKLKAAGWSEYKIRQQGKLSTSTIKAIKTGDTYITVRVLERICEMLGAQPNEVLVYENDYVTVSRLPSRVPQPTEEEVARFMDEVYAEYDALENPETPRSTFVGIRMQGFYNSWRLEHSNQ